MMPNIFLFQLGTGGMAWIIFFVGIIWCSFAWWRTNKNKPALAAVITATITFVSVLCMVAFIASVIMRISVASSRNIETIALGVFVLMAISWATTSLCFIAAALRSQNPKDLTHPQKLTKNNQET